MKRLLISVRNVEESRIAISGGCHILDIKDPTQGPLGKASNSIIESVLHEYKLKTVENPSLGIPVSLAMGELNAVLPQKFYASSHNQLKPINSHLSVCVRYCKWGTSGLKNTHSSTWPKIERNSDDKKRPVMHIAVCYIDHQTCDGLSPEETARLNQKWGSRIILFDTFDKQNPHLFELWSDAEIRETFALCKAYNLEIAVAGKLDEGAVSKLLDYPVDIIGVRSLVCKQNNREQEIELSKVHRLYNTFSMMNCLNRKSV